jgi:hypothetical protein
MGGEGAGVCTAKVSEVVSPLALVADTTILKPSALFGTIPMKVCLEASNCSQDGSAAPFERLQLAGSVVPRGVGE